MTFSGKAKKYEVQQARQVRAFNSCGGFGLLCRDGFVHLFLESKSGGLPSVACSRSLSSIAAGDALLYPFFLSRSGQCKQCLDHFYASEIGRAREAKILQVFNEKKS